MTLEVEEKSLSMTVTRGNFSVLLLFLTLCSLCITCPAVAHSGCSMLDLEGHSRDMAGKTLYAVRGEDEIPVDVFKSAWGQKPRCSVGLMRENPHFIRAGKVYAGELKILDEELESDRITYAQGQYVDFLKWRSSEDRNQHSLGLPH